MLAQLQRNFASLKQRLAWQPEAFAPIYTVEDGRDRIQREWSWDNARNIEMEEVTIVARSNQGQKTTVSCNSSDSISNLKQKLSQWQNTSSDNLILLLRGRSLDEEETIQSEGIRNGAKLTVLVKGGQFRKVKTMELQPPAEVPVMSRSQSLVQSGPFAPRAGPAGLQRGTGLQRPPPAVPKPNLIGNSAAGSGPKPAGLRTAPNPSLVPAASPSSSTDEAVQVIKDMGLGYSEADIKSALSRARGNVDAAVSILMGDEPEGRSIEDIRRQIRERPELLEMYEQKALESPQMRAAEEANPGAIRALLTGGGQVPQVAQVSRAAASLPLTPQDEEAIKNIVSMGFEYEKAKKAYESAEKNVELAISILCSDG